MLRATVVTHHAAGGLDARGQRRLRHEPTAPHLVEQLVLGDDSIAVLDQVDQHVEDLRLDRHEAGGPFDVAGVGVDGMLTEADQHRRRC